MADFSTLSLSFEGTIATLTINRPQSLNALNSQVIKELGQAVAQFRDMKFSELQGVILTGSGEKAFVAGADIKEMTALTPAQAKAFAEDGQRTLSALETLQVPVIAAVNGFALGGGLELALACDFIFASENAKMGLPEVSLGLIPGFGGTVRLARAVGLPKARELVFTGDMLTAAEALSIGLVNKVVPQAELLATAKKTLATVASRGPLAVNSAKSSIYRGWDLSIDEAMKNEASHFSALFSSQDFREGTGAFVEKRKAAFKGN